MLNSTIISFSYCLTYLQLVQVSRVHQGEPLGTASLDSNPSQFTLTDPHHRVTARY